MATFAFKALDLSGVHTRGELEADDKQSVASQLRSKGLIVIDIEERKGAAGQEFAQIVKLIVEQINAQPNAAIPQ